MEVQRYLDRISFKGKLHLNIDTFRQLHRAHALAVPYENLDVQFGAPVTRRAEDAYEKIVMRGRGGWCYEMNGLFGWALEEIGFDVRHLAGAVMRDVAGDNVIGNHLVLIVGIKGQNWVGDVGFGDGFIEPQPLRDGAIKVGPLDCELTQLDNGWWRYFNDARSGGPNFDFNLEINDETLLEDRCQFLQSDPASPFVQNAVVQRWSNNAHHSMRGRVLRKLTASADTKTLVESADEYVTILKDVFSLDLPEAASLWPRICARHDEIFNS
ncbi:MAG: arylamine N-acetyltransferase [Parvularculaceae bacterium]